MISRNFLFVVIYRRTRISAGILFRSFPFPVLEIWILDWSLYWRPFTLHGRWRASFYAYQKKYGILECITWKSICKVISKSHFQNSWARSSAIYNEHYLKIQKWFWGHYICSCSFAAEIIETFSKFFEKVGVVSVSISFEKITF